MIGLAFPSSLPLPSIVRRRIDSAARTLMQPDGHPAYDFTRPEGEAALVPSNSLSWRIFKNPVAVFIGGAAAVVLELAEPAVRTGVWGHSSFRTDPVDRLQRTGRAAMVTVYGARSLAEAMIARVVRLHDRITGETPAGEAYRANDVGLLTWVQATAAFGFAAAYDAYVRPLGREELDRLYAEGPLWRARCAGLRCRTQGPVRVDARAAGAFADHFRISDNPAGRSRRSDAVATRAAAAGACSGRDHARLGAPTAGIDGRLWAWLWRAAAGATNCRPIRQAHVAFQPGSAILFATRAPGGLSLPKLNAARLAPRRRHGSVGIRNAMG